MKALAGRILVIMGCLVPCVLFAEKAVEGDRPFLVLGAETNSLRCGLYIYSTNHVLMLRKGKLEPGAHLALLNLSTKSVLLYWPKDIGQRIEMSVVDSNNVAVPYTDAGRAFGKPLEAPKTGEVNSRRKNFEPISLPASEDYIFDWPNYSDRSNSFILSESLPKSFEFPHSGNYKLTVSQRAYITDPTGRLTAFVFSPVTIDLVVEK